MFFRTTPNVASLASIEEIDNETLLSLNELSNLLYLDKKKLTKPMEIEKFADLEKL